MMMYEGHYRLFQAIRECNTTNYTGPVVVLPGADPETTCLVIARYQ